MIYTIYKTSTGSSQFYKPCKNAIPKEGYKDEDEYKEYCIEINSLEDLQQLIKEVGEIIINDDTIEIYDSYRE